MDAVLQPQQELHGMLQRNCLLLGLALVTTLSLVDDAAAQNCFGQLTIAEAMDNSDALILVKATSDAEVLEVVEVLIQPKSATLPVGTKMVKDSKQRKLDGKLFVMFGALEGEDSTMTWSTAPTSIAAWQYVKTLPRADQPVDRRLPFFLKHLQSDDSVIRVDAGLELFGQPNDDLVRLAQQTSDDVLRDGVVNSKLIEHASLYGFLLGLKGNTADGKLLEQKVMEPVEGFRMRIQLMMAGYLLLSGENGLSRLEDNVFRDDNSSYAEVLSALRALQYMREYGKERIAPDRLRASVRMLLARSDIADMAISELTQLRDWSAQGQLIELYGKKDFNEWPIKRAIILFTYAAAADTAEELPLSVDMPAHVTRARAFLADLEKRDPKTLADANRFRKVIIQE
jgi:hypothetical protein